MLQFEIDRAQGLRKSRKKNKTAKAAAKYIVDDEEGPAFVSPAGLEDECLTMERVVMDKYNVETEPMFLAYEDSLSQAQRYKSDTEADSMNKMVNFQKEKVAMVAQHNANVLEVENAFRKEKEDMIAQHNADTLDKESAFQREKDDLVAQHQVDTINKENAFRKEKDDLIAEHRADAIQKETNFQREKNDLIAEHQVDAVNKENTFLKEKDNLIAQHRKDIYQKDIIIEYLQADLNKTKVETASQLSELQFELQKAKEACALQVSDMERQLEECSKREAQLIGFARDREAQIAAERETTISTLRSQIGADLRAKYEKPAQRFLTEVIALKGDYATQMTVIRKMEEETKAILAGNLKSLTDEKLKGELKHGKLKSSLQSVEKQFEVMRDSISSQRLELTLTLETSTINALDKLRGDFCSVLPKGGQHDVGADIADCDACDEARVEAASEVKAEVDGSGDEVTMPTGGADDTPIAEHTDGPVDRSADVHKDREGGDDVESNELVEDIGPLREIAESLTMTPGLLTAETSSNSLLDYVRQINSTIKPFVQSISSEPLDGTAGPSANPESGETNDQSIPPRKHSEFGQQLEIWKHEYENMSRDSEARLKNEVAEMQAKLAMAVVAQQSITEQYTKTVEELSMAKGELETAKERLTEKSQTMATLLTREQSLRRQVKAEVEEQLCGQHTEAIRYAAVY